jgi:hypothetical protein
MAIYTPNYQKMGQTHLLLATLLLATLLPCGLYKKAPPIKGRGCFLAVPPFLADVLRLSRWRDNGRGRGGSSPPAQEWNSANPSRVSHQPARL